MKDSFRKLKKASTIRFVIVLSLLAFFSKIPMGIIGAIIMDIVGITNPLFSSALQEPTLTYDDMFLAVVFAPVFETLIGQALPIGILQRFVQKETPILVGSALIFMLFHFPAIEFFPSAFVVGLIFAWAWIVKRHLGWWQAFIVVTLIHSMHNALVAMFAALLL